MMIGGSNNYSLFGFLAQSWKTNDASPATSASQSAPAIAVPKTSAKDEYIPCGVSSLPGTNKIEVGKTGASSSEYKPTIAELEDVLVDFLKTNSTCSYNEMVLEIDGNGKFVASDHAVFNINGSGESDAELTRKYLEELNDIEVGGKTLGEAFLQAYADEFGVDLNAAKAEGQEVKSLLFNFAHGIAGDQFISRSTARTFHIGDAFYGVDDKTQEKGMVSQSGGVARLGKMQSDSVAKAQELLDRLEGAKSNESSKDSIRFKPTSFMTNLLGTRQAASPMSGVSQDLNRMLLEGTITRVLEAHNVELKEGDTISLSLNGKGEFSINADASSIWGAKGEEIEGLCATLEKALNGAQTEDGQSLGRTLLEQFSSDTGFDLGEARTDENFSVSFSFTPDSKTGKNEITNAQLRSLANVNKDKASKDDDTFMPDTRDLDVVVP